MVKKVVGLRTGQGGRKLGTTTGHGLAVVAIDELLTAFLHNHWLTRIFDSIAVTHCDHWFLFFLLHDCILIRAALIKVFDYSGHSLFDELSPSIYALTLCLLLIRRRWAAEYRAVVEVVHLRHAKGRRRLHSARRHESLRALPLLSHGCIELGHVRRRASDGCQRGEGFLQGFHLTAQFLVLLTLCSSGSG